MATGGHPTDRERPSRVGATLVAGGVAVAATVCSVLASVPVFLLLGLDPSLDLSVGGFTALFVASYAGSLLAALGYLRVSDRGLAYLDVRVPGTRDLGYVLGGVLAVFGVLLVLGVLVSALDVPSTPHNLFEPGMDPNVLLVLIPLVLLVNAPVEELVFRNVVQKRLAEAFSDRGAVVLASLVFALVHFPAYYNPVLSATAVSLVVVFAASLVFGLLYARTDNVVVPSLVHGLYNAIQIGLFYLFVTGEQTVAALL